MFYLTTLVNCIGFTDSNTDMTNTKLCIVKRKSWSILNQYYLMSLEKQRLRIKGPSPRNWSPGWDLNLRTTAYTV